MRKKKKKRPIQSRKKRNKKYPGAAAQSRKDLEKDEQLYKPAIDYLSGFTSNLNILSHQLNDLTSPIYQPSLFAAVNKFQDQFASFRDINAILPNIDHLTESSPLLDISRQATLAASLLSVPSTISNISSIISDNYKPWYAENIAKASLYKTSPLDDMRISEVSESIASMLGRNNLSALSLQSNIAKATEYSVFAEKSLYSVTLENLGNRIGLDPTSKEHLTSSFLSLSSSYSDYLKAIEINPTEYALLNPRLTTIPPIEYYSGANLLETISLEEDITSQETFLKNNIQYENEYSLSTYLPKIDPGLFSMWKGAIESYHSNNSDKVRHFTVSLRELFTQIMHKLAPEKDVKKWNQEDIYYDDKGKPTRKARLLYICRNITDETFKTFVTKDVDTTVAFIDIFQKGTHGINPNFSPNNLLTIKCKAETTLKFLLEIHFSTNQ